MNPQFRRLVLDLGPLIIFFVGFRYLGILGATAAFMAAVLAALAAGIVLDKKISPMPLFTAVLVLIFGVVVGGVAAWIRQGKWRRAVRQLEAESRSLRSDLDDARRRAAAVTEPPSPPTTFFDPTARPAIPPPVP